jgi:uncharacterized protein (TIGR03437 family)
VNGANFVASSVVRWNGASRTTTFVSSVQLTASIPASDIASAGTAQVTVFTPAPGGGTSTALNFSVITIPAPTLSSLSPSTTFSGSAAFTLTANGANFITTSVVQWNGSSRTTTFVSASQLTASIPASDIVNAGSAQVTVSTPGGGVSAALTFTISGPLLNQGGIVNAASFAPGVAVAAGGIATAFGAELAAALATAGTLPLPTTLAEITVRMNSILAPLFLLNGSQINLQVPWELAGQSQATVVATVGTTTLAPVTVNLVSAAPGIFTTNAQGTGQGAILISGTATFVAPTGSIPGAVSRPANRGEFVTIFCTGLGAVTNRPASGAVGPPGPGLAQTTSPVSVSIGGIAATPSFAGLAPGFVGLYQVDVPIPANVTPGNALPLTISIGGAISNSVTIAVQ